jgi:hypothetical protein
MATVLIMPIVPTVTDADMHWHKGFLVIEAGPSPTVLRTMRVAEARGLLIRAKPLFDGAIMLRHRHK